MLIKEVQYRNTQLCPPKEKLALEGQNQQLRAAADTAISSLPDGRVGLEGFSFLLCSITWDSDQFPLIYQCYSPSF